MDWNPKEILLISSWCLRVHPHGNAFVCKLLRSCVDSESTYVPFSSSCCVQFLLLSVCIQRASFMRMLSHFFCVFGEFQAPPIGWNMIYMHVESFTMDLFGCKYSWNDAEEDEETKMVLVRVDMTWVVRTAAVTVYTHTHTNTHITVYRDTQTQSV